MTATTERWIVGIDGSASSQTALTWAAAAARRRGDVEISALGVWHVPPAMALFTAKRGFGVDELGIEATAGHQVDEAIAAIGHADDSVGDSPLDVTITPATLEGQAGHVLVEEADEHADLLVVGRSGSGELRQRLGSVSRYCATNAKVPVVVVPEQLRTAGDGSVAVGFDGSENAAAALTWALEHVAPPAVIRTISSVELAPWLDDDVIHARYGDEIAEQRVQLMAAIDAIDTAGRTERHVVVHAPRKALVDASDSCDLLVVGARGRSRLAAGLLGSVSTSILEDTRCPVVIVPHEATDQADGA